MPGEGDARPPLIAVTGRRRSAAGVQPGLPQLDRLHLDVYFTGYAEHLLAAGGMPVHLPSGSDPAAVASRVDGLVLTGGADVDPARYGAGPGEIQVPTDPGRDGEELSLLEAVLALDLPVLAICRGEQLLNVSRGGTLHGHLPQHPAGRDHEVELAAGSTLAELYGPSTTVNSLHHQGVNRLGDDLVVVGRATDGVVEGLEWPGRDVVGVQWHPEQMAGPQPLFGWLVAAARRRVRAG